MTLHSFLPLCVGIAILILGLFVFIKKPSINIARSFLFITVSLCIYLFSCVGMFSVRDNSAALIWARISTIGVIFAPIAFYQFIVVFLNLSSERKLLFITYAYGCCVILLNITTDVVIDHAKLYYWGYFGIGGWGLIPVAIMHVALFGRIIHILVVRLRRSKGPEANQIRYLLLALIFVAACGVDYFPTIGTAVYPFGYLMLTVMLLLIAYAIVQHQLMDITVVFRKTFSYSVVLLLLLLPCLAIMWLTETYIAAVRHQALIYSFLFVLVGFAFPRIKIQTERNLANILFKGAFDYRKTLDRLSREMARLQGLDKLLSYATETIARAVDTDFLAVYLLGANREYTLESSHEKLVGGAPPTIGFDSRLVRFMTTANEIVNRAPGRSKNKGENVSDPDLSAELDQLGAELSIPIKFENELRGLMLVGKKQSAGDYSKDELTVLSTIANQLAVAIENSKRYEEIQELNINLEKKVEQRTEELQKANEELKKLDALKSEFFSKVSHELRTPLTNIILPIQSILAQLGDKLDPENVLEKKAMLRNAHRLLKRINEILDIAKIEAGKMTVKAGPKDLGPILEDIVFASSIAAKEIAVELSYYSDPKLPSIYVDAEKIEKVFSNLIGNALKFTDRGGKVEISTKEAHDAVEVSVADTGIGIASEHIAYIFERFHQVDGSTSRKYEGTGLGLCLVKEFVDLHHGSVQVQSEVGRGSTFTVHLLKGNAHFEAEELEQPFETGDGFLERRGEERRREDRRQAERRTMGDQDRETIDLLQIQLSDLSQGRDYVNSESTLPAAFEGKRIILVVEDNRDLASNIARILARDYRTYVTYNGKQALEQMEKILPDLVVSDVMMPEMDGYELCARLRENERTRHIPIVMLTAKTTIADKIEGLKHGADHYLAKPFNPNELSAVVDSLLMKKEFETQLNKRNAELEKAMCDLEQTQVQLVHTARLESVGQLSAGIAHEIKNNVYCIRAGLEGFNKRLAMIADGKLELKDTYDGLLKALETNNKAIERTLYIVNSLLDFSRKDKEGMAFSDINQGIESTIAIALPRIKDKVVVQKEFEELPRVECKIEEINQVIMNMLINAHQAIEKTGTVRIRTSQDGDQVRISLADDGPGIPEENLDKIFSPFFTTKEKTVNTGLGLSICHNIIKNHHGSLDVKSASGQGTEFIITLPIKQPAKAA